MPRKYVKSKAKAKVNLNPKMRKAVDKEIKKVLYKRIEPKGYDSSASAVLLGNGLSTYIQNLTPLAQGTDINQRIGNKVRPISLHMRSIFSGALNSTAAGPYSTSVRMLIIQDSNDDGVVPVATDIFAASGNTTSALNWENSVINHRFKVLLDKLFELNKIDNTTGTATSVVTFTNASYRAVSKYIKCIKCSPVCYSGTANTAYAKGQFYLVVMADSNTDKPTVNYTIRFKYQDI